MNAQITLLRQQLSQPRTKLDEIDKALAELEESIPKRPGRWSDRSRRAAVISYQLCRNECVEAMAELDEFCKVIDIAIEK